MEFILKKGIFGRNSIVVSGVLGRTLKPLFSPFPSPSVTPTYFKTYLATQDIVK